MENKWILNSGNSPKHPEFRLFCFPYSGGSASYYSGWNQLFGDNIEILPIQYPGHETRADEPLIPDVRALAEAALEGIVPDTDMPFGFFGHSRNMNLICHRWFFCRLREQILIVYSRRCIH